MGKAKLVFQTFGTAPARPGKIVKPHLGLLGYTFRARVTERNLARFLGVIARTRGWALPALLLIAIPAPAQVNSSSLEGRVLDPQAAAIPGANLVLSSPTTGFSRTAVSSPEGIYRFTALGPGEYQLRVEASGFAPSTRKFVLEVDQALRLDTTLQLGRVEQEVKVVSNVEQLRTADASLGEVIEPTLTQQLPLNGRHLLDLALLAPATHQGFGAQAGKVNPLYWRPLQNSALSVGGNRPNANSYLLDGSTNTDPTFNTLSLSPSPDAVREFKVQTGSYSAEFGGAGGGQINVVTKSGSNQLHGDVYEFIRNSALDARAFNEPSPIPHLAQNQFGASIGGPIRKNKAFFFANYEGFRKSNGVTQIETVPTLAERGGDFRQSGLKVFNPFSAHPNPGFDPSKPVSPSNPKIVRDPFLDNNVIPKEMLNSAALDVLSHLPLPNLPSAGGSDSNNYLDLRTNRNAAGQTTARLDYNFAGGDTFFARYSAQSERDFTPQNLPGFGAFDSNLAQNSTISYTRVLSPSAVNTFWFGLSRLSMHRYSENNFTHDFVSELGIAGIGFGGKGAWGMPWFAVQGYNGIGDSFAATPVQDWDTVLQWGDIWSRQIGRHSVRLGGDYRYFFWPMWGFFQNRGFYQFTSGFTTRTATNDGTGAALASFLLGLPAVKQRQAGIPQMDLRQWYADAFAQDDWRVSGATTLNFGLRYEYMSALTDVSIPSSNLFFVGGRPEAFLGGQLGMPRGLWYPNTLKFAPRFGLAHTVGGRLGLVVRAAVGVFFTPVDMNTWCNQRHNVPYVFPETQQSDNFIPGLLGFDFSPPVLGQTVVSFASFEPHSRAQYVNQWSFSVERPLPGDMVLEAGYQGARGYHLQRAHLINNAPPGPGPLNPRRPFQTVSFLPASSFTPDNPQGFAIAGSTFPVSAINLLENSARSWYDAGWVAVRRRFDRGLALLANYTWAKNLSDAPDFRSPMDEAAIPQNSSDLRGEKGLACDVRHRFSGSVLYELPGLKSRAWLRRLTTAWTVAGVYQVQSGFPFTVSVFGDTANAGTLLGENPVRADATGAPLFPSGTRTTAQWFNPQGFVAPPAFQFGNAGRNTVVGPGMHLLDVALTRQFGLTERVRLEFRTEVFNALNHTNLGTPSRFVNTPQFSSITDPATPARQVQLSARITF